MNALTRPSVVAAIALGVGTLTASMNARAGQMESAQAAQVQKVDCRGGDITISGENRTVELANCAVVNISGSHNHVTGRLPKHAKVLVTGNANVVSLHPPNGVSFSHIKDRGKDNQVDGPG